MLIPIRRHEFAMDTPRMWARETTLALARINCRIDRLFRNLARIEARLKGGGDRCAQQKCGPADPQRRRTPLTE